MRLNESADRRWILRVSGCGLCAVVGLYLASAALEALFLPMRRLGQSVQCQSNVIRLTRAFRMYADDYQDRLPPAVDWMGSILLYAPEERRLHCPAVSREGEAAYGYAMNARTAGKLRSAFDEPDSTALVYDSSRPERSASDLFASLPSPPRHITRARKNVPGKRVNWVGFLGGTTKASLEPAPRVP